LFHYYESVKHLYRIQQIAKDDCGPVSLKMVLAFIHQSPDYLFLLEAWPRPMSLKQMIDIAIDYGVFFKGYRLQHYSHLYKMDQVFIALMNQAQFHYVMVIPKPKGKLLLIDPNGTTKQLSIQDFFKHFSGYLLRIQDKRNHVLTTKQYFQTPSIPPYHYVIVSILTTLALLVLLMPFQLFAFIGLSLAWTTFTILWVFLGWKQIKHINDQLIRLFHIKITSRTQYQHFFHIKNQLTTLPYRILYRQVLLVILIVYGVIAQWTFLPFAAIYWLLGLLCLRPWRQQRQKHIVAIEADEKKLIFPLLQPQSLLSLHHHIDRLTQHEVSRIVLMAIMALMTVLLYHTYFPLNHASSWFVAWSMLIIGRQTIEALQQIPHEKKTLRQSIYQFINAKQTMVK